MRGAAQRWLWLVAAAVVWLAGCATAPTEYHEPPPLAIRAREAINERVFERAWSLVNKNYFDAGFRGVDWRAMRERYRPEAARAADTNALYAVLNRMCAELKESHLGAMTPRRAHELDTEHRPAIGIRWQLLEGKRVVTDVVPGSPAEKAGIQRGWILVSRNGQPLRESDTFVTRLRDPVSFGFIDLQDRPRSFTLQPQLLDFERFETRVLADGFVYLRFDRFSRDALSWLSEQLKQHAAAPGVIIDLRQNGGGNTLALNVAVAEFFPHRVDEGRLVRRDGKAREARSFSWLSARYSGRVVLLTGSVTASAAEIFAHVLQHYRRALVMGRRTAGAVIYARSYRLPDGGSIQVPIVDYVALDGRRLEGHGVMPAVSLPPPTFAQLRAGYDADVFAAIDALRRMPPTTAAPVEAHRR